VHRAVAWVAWAEWICNSAAAQAVDDTGLADFTGRRGLFFLSDRMRARAEERFRGNVVRHAFSGRRLPQDPAVAVGIPEHRVGLDIADVQHYTLQAAGLRRACPTRVRFASTLRTNTRKPNLGRVSDTLIARVSCNG
jgi:hypothetical protein